MRETHADEFPQFANIDTSASKDTSPKSTGQEAVALILNVLDIQTWGSMIPQEQIVLCLPRSAFADWKQFTPWNQAAEMIQATGENMTWLPRREAEASENVIQPIPCTMVFGQNRSFHVFRRIANGRPDLRKRISLVVGGHIDRADQEQDILPLVESTLMREVSEELGVNVPLTAKRIGVVVDRSSILGSRHIGIVHEIVIEGRATPQATEEFFCSLQVYAALLLTR